MNFKDYSKYKILRLLDLIEGKDLDLKLIENLFKNSINNILLVRYYLRKL